MAKARAQKRMVTTQPPHMAPMSSRPLHRRGAPIKERVANLRLVMLGEVMLGARAARVFLVAVRRGES